MSNSTNRRSFIKGTSAIAAASIVTRGVGLEQGKEPTANFATDGVQIDDKGWSLWLDRSARWQDDTLYLPDTFSLGSLPVNKPTGGWQALFATVSGEDFKSIQLPTTVEEHFWGTFGKRSYEPLEYFYAIDKSNPIKDDDVPQNGAYRGVSWFYRPLDIPAAMQGRRILLDIRAARMRAEVYLNGKLIGSSIMEELPFTCDPYHESRRPLRLARRQASPLGQSRSLSLPRFRRPRPWPHLATCAARRSHRRCLGA
jgi:beta-galactosidase